MADEEKKIIIDEDWKAQVQREREEARAKNQDAPESPEEAGDEDAVGEEVLQASFDALVGSLATQAMFALGVIAAEGQRQVMVNLDQAKFTIDMLEVLREKTKGNLTPDEKAHLDEAISELQHLYVARVQQFQEQAMRDAGIDLNNLKNPESPLGGA